VPQPPCISTCSLTAALRPNVGGRGDALRAVLAARRLVRLGFGLGFGFGFGLWLWLWLWLWLREARLLHAPAPSSRAPCASSRRRPAASSSSHGSRGSPCAAGRRGREVRRAGSAHGSWSGSQEEAEVRAGSLRASVRAVCACRAHLHVALRHIRSLLRGLLRRPRHL
jgi:hypothetical protein